jgi:hypothetical protein
VKQTQKLKQNSVRAANNNLSGDIVERADGNADNSGEVKNRSESNANEDNKEASVSNTDKGKGKQQPEIDEDVVSGITTNRDVPIRAQDKGKQRAQDVDQGDDHRGPREERIDSTQSSQLPQPLQPHNAAESAAWIQEHSGSVEQPPTPPSKYRIPCVGRPNPTQKLKILWPRHTDASLVTLTELEVMVADFQAYSEKNVDLDWIALKPRWWLQMLSHICEQARAHADIEKKRMERDMHDYRAIFPLNEAAALQWPMIEDEHWFRYELRNLLVD